MTSSHEWIGGIGSMPGWITGEAGEDYRPDVLMWIDAENGTVLGSTIDHPDKLLGVAAARLQAAIQRPLVGVPATPSRLRVNSEPLAEVLRNAYPDIDIVISPTPEFDAVMQAMTRDMAGKENAPWWQPDVDVDALRRLFDAAADLYETAPWSRVPHDSCLLYLRLPSFDGLSCVISVIGQQGESFGFVVFDTIESYDRYTQLARAGDAGKTPTVPRHAALSYDRGADVSREVRRLIGRHGWRIASENAYPSVLQIEPDLVARPSTADEVMLFEVLARALRDALVNPEPWQRAWEGEGVHEITLSVETSTGSVDVFLGSQPSEAFARFKGSDSELLAAFEALDLSEGIDSVDKQQLALLERSLLARVSASAEAAALAYPDLGMRLLLDYAASWFSQPVTRLTAGEVNEILFEIVPHKVSVPASDAPGIVDSTRAALQWMAARYPLEHADACFALLDDHAVQRLEGELSNPGNFGPAKAMVMAGREAGFDMHTREGIDAFMRVTAGAGADSGPYGFDPAYDVPSAPPQDPVLERKQKKKRKANRKAARKARKKNR